MQFGPVALCCVNIVFYDDAKTTVVSEYTGSLLASMKALCGLGDILTEHIFFTTNIVDYKTFQCQKKNPL